MTSAILGSFDRDEKGPENNNYFVIYYKYLGDCVYKTAAVAVIDGYTGAAAVASATMTGCRCGACGDRCLQDKNIWPTGGRSTRVIPVTSFHLNSNVYMLCVCVCVMRIRASVRMCSVRLTRVRMRTRVHVIQSIAELQTQLERVGKFCLFE